MNKILSTLAVVALALAGCIPSLHPLVAEKDAVLEAKLVGVWAPDGKESETLTLRRRDEDSNVYRAEHIDEDGRKGTFDVCATQIEGALFLDFYPQEPDPKLNGFYQVHLVPGHTFLRANFLEDGTLRLDMLKPDWLAEQLKKNPATIAHEKLEDGDQLVLTAPTAKLRAFIGTITADDDAWGEGTPLQRQPTAKPVIAPKPAVPATAE